MIFLFIPKVFYRLTKVILIVTSFNEITNGTLKVINGANERREKWQSWESFSITLNAFITRKVFFYHVFKTRPIIELEKLLVNGLLVE